MNPLGMSGASLRALAVCAVMTAAWLAATPAAGQDDWPAPAWLMDADAVSKFRKQEFTRISAAKRSQSLSAAEKEVLQSFVSAFLSQLTHSEDKDLPKLVTEKLVGNTGEILNALTSEVARDFLLADTLAKAPQLLMHPKGIVRLNAMLLICQLSTKPADLGKGTPAVAYVPIHKVLCEQVQNSNQILAVRIAAAVGLDRVCSDGSPVPSERAAITMALLTGLEQVPVGGNDGTLYFRWRAVRALGQVDEFNNPQAGSRPVAYERLLAIVANRKESFSVRAEALRSISRLPLGSNANLPLVIHESCALLNEMNASYAKHPNSVYWRVSYSNVFFAYKPGLKSEADRNLGLNYQIGRPGLGAHTQLVNDAWKVVAAASKPVVDNEPPLQVPDAAAKAVEKFLADHPVADRKPTPTSEPLPQANAAPVVEGQGALQNPESGSGATPPKEPGGGE